MKSTFAARLSLFVAAVALAACAASSAIANIGIPLGPSGPIQVRRGWGSTTGGTVDSTQFYMRGTTDGTASGAVRETLNVINIANWNRCPFPGQGGAAVVVGTLWITFNNAAATGASGDTATVYTFQFSIDGTNWTGERTAALYSQTAGATVAAVPIVFDADANLTAATGDIGQAQWLRVILRGDATSKNVVASVYETHYDIRQPPY